MSIGEEYLSSNSRIAYPFDSTSEGLAHDCIAVFGASPKLPVDIFVDAFIEVDEDAYVRLSSIATDGTSHGFTFTKTVGDTTTTIGAIGCTNTTDTYTVLNYVSADGTITLRFVLDSAAMSSYMTALLTDGGTVTFDDTLTFDDAVTEVAVPLVRSFTLYTSASGLAGDPVETGTVDNRISGDVRIVCGYNMDISNAPYSSDLDQTEITVDAEPGAGAGTVPCDEITESSGVGVRTIMGLNPSNGNIQLEPGPEGCYDVVVAPTSGTILLQGNCYACCSCDDYAAVLAAIRAMKTRFSTVIDALNSGHQQYEDGVTEYNAYIAAHEEFQ